MNLIDLKERIAISTDYTPEERDFLLKAINETIDWGIASGEVKVEDPGNYIGRMDFIYVFLSVDDGGEGICAINNLPLVMSDRNRAERIKSRAHDIGRLTNKVIRLVRFGKREDIEVLRP